MCSVMTLHSDPRCRRGQNQSHPAIHRQHFLAKDSTHDWVSAVPLSYFATDDVACCSIEGNHYRVLTVDRKRVKLRIWDTPGVDDLRMTAAGTFPSAVCVTCVNTWFLVGCVRDAEAVLLVYDPTDEKSFHNLRSWIRLIEEHAVNTFVHAAIVSTKSDLLAGDRKQVSWMRCSAIYQRCFCFQVVDVTQGRELAEEYGLDFYETCASSGRGISELFTALVRSVNPFRKERQQPVTFSSASSDFMFRKVHSDAMTGSHTFFFSSRGE